jgi:hypothetical protein
VWWEAVSEKPTLVRRAHKHPNAAGLDSLNVKTIALAGEKGYDAGKKI